MSEKRAFPDFMKFDLELTFREDQRKYVSKLVKWLSKEGLYTFSLSNERSVKPPQKNEDEIILTIESSWTRNLDRLQQKINQLFPYEEYDD
jgi:endo-1,4-beta-mannosidase